MVMILPGSITPYGDPSEVEARASISLLLGSLSSDIQPEVFSMSLDEIKTYIQSTDSVVDNASDDGGVVLLLASDNAKPRLNDFLRAIEKSEGVQSAVGGEEATMTYDLAFQLHHLLCMYVCMYVCMYWFSGGI